MIDAMNNFKWIGKLKVRTCLRCGKELKGTQSKYCSTDAIIVTLRKSKFTIGLTDDQLRHYYSF